MSGLATDYYSAKANTQASGIILLVALVAILTPIGLGMYVKENLPLCATNQCDKKLVYGAMAGIVYLIIVAIMQFQKYRKEKAFGEHIKEKKKTNDELKKIDDENKAFSKKTHIISAPFYIFLVLVGLYIMANMAGTMCIGGKWCICSGGCKV